MSLKSKGCSVVLWTAMCAGTLVLTPLSASALLIAPKAPNAPTSLNASVLEGRVTLTWGDASDNETGFRIVREVGTPTGAWLYSSAVTVGANVTSYTEQPAAGNYRYKLRAYNSRGNSSYTNYTTVNVGTAGSPPAPPPPPPPPPPPAPTPSLPATPGNFTATPNGLGGVILAWNDVQGETAYHLERNPAFNPATIITPSDWNAWGDTPGAGTFAYRMRSVNSVGGSAWTNWVTANSTVGSQPPPPPTSPPPPPPPPAPAPGVFAVIPAGSGFTGASDTPAVMGVPENVGYSAKAIARWDVVPYQTISGNFNIGVVAFHLAGINRVEFSLNGGAWTPVTQMQRNPTTNVWEYTATINGNSLPDGPLEVRARVIPNRGISRVLQDANGQDLGDKSLRLFNNSGGTMPNTNRAVYVSPNGSDTAGNGSSAMPFWSIGRAINHVVGSNPQGVCEGATVYLDAGVYQYPEMANVGGADNRWFTLEGKPGVARAQVVLTNPSATPVQKKLRVRNLTLKQLGGDSPVLAQRSDPFNNHFWIDNCDIEGRGFIGSTVSNSPCVNNSSLTPCFYTDVNVRNTAGTGLNANVILARNVNAQNIGSDFSNVRTLQVNMSVNHMRFNDGVHPDVVQVPIGGIENMIIFNLKATDVAAQAITLGDVNYPMKNVAVVNCLLDKIPTDPQCQWLNGGSTNDHHLWWNITWVNYQVIFNNNNVTNLSFRNNVIPYKTDTTTRNYPGWIADNNHIVNGQFLFGASCTAGDPGFLNPGARDYRPGTNSPLVGRLGPALVTVPVDLAGVPIDPMLAPAAIGAYQR